MCFLLAFLLEHFQYESPLDIRNRGIPIRNIGIFQYYYSPGLENGDMMQWFIKMNERC